MDLLPLPNKLNIFVKTVATITPCNEKKVWNKLKELYML
jgi:hypothetical protein